MNSQNLLLVVLGWNGPNHITGMSIQVFFNALISIAITTIFRWTEYCALGLWLEKVVKQKCVIKNAVTVNQNESLACMVWVHIQLEFAFAKTICWKIHCYSRPYPAHLWDHRSPRNFLGYKTYRKLLKVKE